LNDANNSQSMLGAVEAGANRKPPVVDILEARHEPLDPFFRNS